MIEDPVWRKEDLKVQLSYWWIDWTGLLLDQHFRSRPRDLRAHDIGKVMAIYPQLAGSSRTVELAQSLKDEALMYAKERGLTKPLQRTLEAAMGN